MVVFVYSVHLLAFIIFTWSGDINIHSTGYELPWKVLFTSTAIQMALFRVVNTRLSGDSISLLKKTKPSKLKKKRLETLHLIFLTRWNSSRAFCRPNLNLFHTLLAQLKAEESEFIITNLKENSIWKIKSEGNRAQNKFNAAILESLEKLETRVFDTILRIASQ